MSKKDLKKYNPDSYVIRKHNLGRGSYGEVKLLYLKQTKEHVVGKFFFGCGSKCVIKKQIADAEREAEILARIEHTNIVRVFGITTSDDCRFGIILEFVPCGDLDKLLTCRSDISLPWKMRLKFFAELANALDYLHNHDFNTKYIHGDLKPQNVLLGEKLQIKLADFGAAKIAQITGATTLTTGDDENTQHTPYYTAPEYLREPIMQRRRSMDIYSYGMIGYEIITRQTVYSGSQVPHVVLVCLIETKGQKPFKSHLEEVARSLIKSNADSEIFTVLKDIMKQCWETNPADRPTIREVKVHLDELVRSQNINDASTDEAAQKVQEKLDLRLSMTQDPDLSETSQHQHDVAEDLQDLQLQRALFAIKTNNDDGVEVHDGYIDASEIKADTRKDGLLGRGDAGTVRVGFTEYHGSVVIKGRRICGSFEEVEVAAKKFQKEIKPMLLANHDNVVRVFGYTCWNSSLATIVECMPGGCLSSLLQLNRKKDDCLLVVDIPEALCLRFCRDISSGVSYLHFTFTGQRIVHGDLKPNNVLLTSDLRCKIGDFGSADMASSINDIDFPSFSHCDTLCALDYIAPERLDNPELRITEAMDVYSVGMIFYAIMRRQHPCKCTNGKSEVKSFCQPSSKPCHEHLKQFTLQCIHQDAEQRPKMLKVRNDLQSVLRSQEVVKIAEQVADVLRTFKFKNFVDSSELVTLTDVSAKTFFNAHR